MMPPPHPLQRLQVSDGLLVTADRWQVAHRYHRQRQNLYFQALYQGGIVSGLGVYPIEAPDQVAPSYRDGRWLQVQPGVAIDAEGNPIVVPEPVTYHIAAQPTQAPLWVYLVLRFVDPDHLEDRDGTHVVQETFRLEEQVSPPTGAAIELCRFVLHPGDAPLTEAHSDFAPTANELDWRYRPLAQPRPLGYLTLGYLTLTPQAKIDVEESLQGLVAALPGLYTRLGGEVRSVPLGLGQGVPADLRDYDLLHLSYADGQAFGAAEIDLLGTFGAAGGTLLIEVASTDTAVAEMFQVWADVVKALSTATTATDPALLTTLYHEQADLERCLALALADHLPALATWVGALATQPNWPLAGLVSQTHPIHHRPFVFGRGLLIHNTPVALFNWGWVVVMVGDVMGFWGGARTQFMPRDTLRSAQELGVNLLQFAWQHRQWARGAPPDPSPNPSLDRHDRLDG